MTAQWHRILGALAVAIAGLGGLIGLTDPDGLGISAGAWEILGNWLSLGAGIVGVGITVIRQLGDPTPTFTDTTTRTITGNGESGQLNIGGGGILGLIALILIIIVAVVWLWLNIDVNEDPAAIVAWLGAAA